MRSLFRRVSGVISRAVPGGAGRTPPAARTRLIRSASLRLALVYGVLFVLSAVVFIGFIWWATIGLLERQVEAAINADERALSERWLDGGLPALADTIQDRLEQNVDDDAIYLMLDPGGTRIAGNLGSWPREVTRTDTWYQLPISRAGMRGTAEVHAFALPGGFRLLVGRDVRDRAILRRLLTDTLLWAVLMVAVLGISGALVVRGLFRRMVRNVALTTGAIARGDLAQRVPLSGSGDEFDRVAETINHMLDRIARLMDGVRQVSNAIAHDLRTPITRARARLEDAAATARTTEEMRGAVERAVADLDGVTAVFEALLRIAEIEAGARRSAFTMVSLPPLLAGLAELYEALAEDKELELELELPEPPAGGSLALQGDPQMIQQAVANLLDNALKFSHPGGVVTLRAEAGDADTVRLSVRDRGIGMAAHDLARASERFFRAESARNTPGSGLGLALVQAVAQLHNGRLELRDADPGLLAVLVLPRGTAPREGDREGNIERSPSAPTHPDPGPPQLNPPSSATHELERQDVLGQGS
ncbi:sensor histidine kinase [Rhizosaccharibacter radicis]|uniref:histidine kinase n=1 Tax=Rhizosaccharibacter radicis TaxID=2782605 RepID=A0ABT1W1P3_9PROT|nr:ATP-binding protein [Acetobacteraceae bacterium KSS12]